MVAHVDNSFSREGNALRAFLVPGATETRVKCFGSEIAAVRTASWQSA
ncbi:hypothetical protein SAMCFNEI73_Ch2279 [Sinorhizobium americanum]|uniref:Uncharacterized protein n=1 Tax=Sinorhizobium americanum TaxID=194963 RepID=A0A1L3LN95_9HYPH|nr:hypothetical protein SAMCCGM7_Ch2171 [Sinorhizobium americanum CCGM7]APG91562.1 hypothetical protein SAMCFNEI73_Ch2279 [Sinorhizobium americanum]